MPVVLGTDLGTTTITALALDTVTGDILARCTTNNTADTTSPADRSRGRSEWDVQRLAAIACTCLHNVAEQLGARRCDLAGLGITGQQHGVVVVDDDLAPRTPFINWQDRRGEQLMPRTGRTYVQEAQARGDADVRRRTGCRLAAGYLGVTLFWLKDSGALPDCGRACSVMDYFAARLTGLEPVTDPTCAAGSGLLNIVTNAWDQPLIAALGLPGTLFPEVRRSGERLGTLTAALAQATGLPAGLPVFVAMGDNQASFLGSVADRLETALINVGTGGQVAAYRDDFLSDPLLETRPFPRGGYLLVSAGHCGGASYAVLERFYREVGTLLFGMQAQGPLFPVMNQLAARVPPGAAGLHCEPFFTGTRLQPDVRASWTGVSADNFTPAHMTRALLEGLAQAFHGGYKLIETARGRPCRGLVGAGNGLRENAVLAAIVQAAFALPMAFARHREEAAYGAALLAATGAGLYEELAAAGRLIRYT